MLVKYFCFFVFFSFLIVVFFLGVEFIGRVDMKMICVLIVGVMLIGFLVLGCDLFLEGIDYMEVSIEVIEEDIVVLFLDDIWIGKIENEIDEGYLVFFEV